MDRTYRKKHSSLIATATLALLAGCGGAPQPTCEAGTEGLDCPGIPAVDGGSEPVSGGDPCDPNPCSEPGRSTCLASGSLHLCVCDPGYVLDADRCVDTLPPECRATHPGDAFEPDGCLQQARNVPPEGLVDEAHTLGEIAGDVDWYRFDAEPGSIWRIGLSAESGLRLGVDVYVDDGATLLASDRSGSSVIDLGVHSAVGRAHYVRVAPLTAGATGSYRVTVTPEADDFPAGRDATESIALGNTRTGWLQHDADVDSLRLHIPAKHRVEISATRLDAGSAALDLLVRDAFSGSELVAFTGSPARGVLWFPFARELLLDISGSGPARREWSLKVVDAGPDDHPDSTHQATQLHGQSLTGAALFEREGDVDVFTFQTLPGHVYRSRCTPLLASGSCQIRLLTPDGQPVGFGNGPAGEIIHEANQSGLYVLQFESSGAVTGYDWTLENLGPEDHSDSTVQATPIGIPTKELAARFEHGADDDVFAFVPTASHLYRATCHAPSTQCSLEVLDPTGAHLTHTQNATEATVTFSASEAVTHWLVASAYGPAGPGDYLLSIEDLGPDDHANVLSASTPIAASSSATSAQLDAPGDRDWFSFAADANSTWSFECAGLVGCRVRITHAAGTELVSGTGAVSFKASTASTFYVEVRQPSASFPAEYTWRLTETVDDHGNDQMGATLVTAPPTQAVPGLLESAGDVDVFELDATWLSTYDLTCVPSGFDTCVLSVFNDLGQRVGYDSSSVIATVRVKARRPGNLYLHVQSLLPGQTGSYSLGLHEFATDDHGDLPQDATVLALHTPVNGAIEMTGDEDYFTVTVTPGSTYTVSTGGMTSALMVHDEAFTPLGSGQNSVTFTASSSGIVQIRVRWGGGSTTTGSYSITVQ